jgi:beta-glucosidase
MSFLPKDFLFGFATAAAQIEGGGEDAEKASGRGRSVRETPATDVD